MAELLLEHFFFRIEIVANEIEKIIRFAKRFPFGHIAWKVRYKNHPMRSFLKYFNFGQTKPLIDSNSISNEADGEVSAPCKRRRSESTVDYPPFVSAKRAFVDKPTSLVIGEPEVFEDALVSISNEADGEVSAPCKRRRSESTVDYPPFVSAKRDFVDKPTSLVIGEPEVFEDALESQVSNQLN